MHRVAFDFGFIQIYWYSIFIFIGMIIACFLIFKEAKKKQIEEDFLINLIFDTIIVGIIGARLYYVIFNLPYYISNPIEILSIWNGGLAIHGGIIAGLIFIYFYCKKHEVNIIDILDIVVVGLIVAQAIGRWGNFFNGEAYGEATTYEALVATGIPKFIINGMYIMGSYREPTFFYESVWCLFGFFGMLIVRKLSKTLKKGQLTGFYLVWYGIARFLIESRRVDALMLGPIKMAQLVSLLFIIVGLLLFFENRNKKEEKYLYKYIQKKEQPAVVFIRTR